MNETGIHFIDTFRYLAGEVQRVHCLRTADLPVRRRRGFSGDCCFATQRHMVDCLLKGTPCETEGREYLKNMTVQEAFYESHRNGTPVELV